MTSMPASSTPRRLSGPGSAGRGRDLHPGTGTASSPKVLRIKGKGVPRGNGGAGDVYVILKIVLPNGPDEELASFMKRR